MKRWVLVLTLLAAGATRAFGDNLEEGAKLFGEKKYAEAADVLQKELADNPTNAKAYLFLASSYEKMEKWAEAADAWDAFVKLTTNEAEKAHGETRSKECRDRAQGKVPAEKTEVPEPTSDFARFEKQDAAFLTLKTKHFIVMAKNRALAETAASEAERHLGRISSVFLAGREWPQTVTIKIHKNHQEYVIEAGTPQWSGGGYSAQDFGGGTIIRRIDLFALDAKGKYIQDLLTKTLPHELTHVVLHEYFGERTFRGLPLAVNEGLAMYVEEGTAVLYESHLAQAAKKGTYYKLNDLFSMRKYPVNVAMFYSEAASATRYLIENMSAEQFQSFLGELKKGSEVNSALQTATGRAGDLLTAMETNWVAMLKAKADELAKKPPTPKPTPKPPVTKPDEKPPEPPKEEPKPKTDDDKDVIEEVK